jgi:hypothetical protein
MHPAADAAAAAAAGAPLRLQAPDGTLLAATVFKAAGPDWIVVGGATAVPRGFYRRFAQHAQARGVNVLTLDYRGIGGSRPATLRGYHPDMADWARQDLATAVAYAAARGPVYLAGHSFGGQAIGLLPNPQLLRAAYVVAVGAGWHGWMPRPERIKVLLMWHGIGPLATAVLGYTPLKRLGVGEDLPASIYRPRLRSDAHLAAGPPPLPRNRSRDARLHRARARPTRRTSCGWSSTTPSSPRAWRAGPSTCWLPATSPWCRPTAAARSPTTAPARWWPTRWWT